MFVDLTSVSIKKFDEYLRFFGTEELIFPICVDISKEQLLLFISICSSTTVMGVDSEGITEDVLPVLAPRCVASFFRNSWLINEGNSVIVAPNMALVLLCLTSPDLFFVFNDENIDVSGDKLQFYVKSSENRTIVLTMHQHNNDIQLRLDCSIRRACKNIFNSYFYQDSYHESGFIEKQEKAFKDLPEERYAVSGGISHFFIFKVFVSKSRTHKNVYPTSIYSLVDFNELGAAMYRIDSSETFAQRASELYDGDTFAFYKGDLSSFFAERIGVIVNEER